MGAMPDDPFSIRIEWARLVSQSLTTTPAREIARRALADIANVRTPGIDAAIASATEAGRAQAGRALTRALAPLLESSRAQLDQAAASLGRQLSEQYLAGLRPAERLDLGLGLDSILAASSFDALPAAQRDWARRIVEEATVGVDTSLDSAADEIPDVPDEMLDTLADTARAFTDAQPAGLSRAAQKKLFIGFIVTVLFLLLLQAQVESDAVKEFVEDAGGAMLVVTPAALGAAYIFDKMNPGPGDGSEPEDEPA